MRSEKREKTEVCAQLGFGFLMQIGESADFSKFSGEIPDEGNFYLFLGVWGKLCVVLGHLLCDPHTGLSGPQHPDLLHGSFQDR